MQRSLRSSGTPIDAVVPPATAPGPDPPAQGAAASGAAGKKAKKGGATFSSPLAHVSGPEANKRANNKSAGSPAARQPRPAPTPAPAPAPTKASNGAQNSIPLKKRSLGMFATLTSQ